MRLVTFFVAITLVATNMSAEQFKIGSRLSSVKFPAKGFKNLNLVDQVGDYPPPEIYRKSVIVKSDLDSVDIVAFIVTSFRCSYAIVAERELNRIARRMSRNKKNNKLALIAIDVNRVRDGQLDLMPVRNHISSEALAFPYVYELSQRFARSIIAYITPEVFVFKRIKYFESNEFVIDHKLVYRGRILDFTMYPTDATYRLRNVISALINEKKVIRSTVPIGFKIQWKWSDWAQD